MECRVSEPKSEFLSLLTSQGRRAFDHESRRLQRTALCIIFPGRSRKTGPQACATGRLRHGECALQGPRLCLAAAT